MDWKLGFRFSLIYQTVEREKMSLKIERVGSQSACLRPHIEVVPEPACLCMRTNLAADLDRALIQSQENTKQNLN
jgi:hypothetical protein